MPGKLIKQWDFTGGVGGPIIHDRLWYYATARDQGQHRTIPDIFPNKNAGDPDEVTYAPDTTRRHTAPRAFTVGRAIYRGGVEDKFNVTGISRFPATARRRTTAREAAASSPAVTVVGALGLGGLTRRRRPKPRGYLRTSRGVQQLTWTMVATNRLLLEAGLGRSVAKWGPFEAPGNPTRATSFA